MVNRKKIKYNIIGGITVLTIMTVLIITLLQLGILQEAFGGYDDYATIENFDSTVSGTCSVIEDVVPLSTYHFVNGVSVQDFNVKNDIVCDNNVFFMKQYYSGQQFGASAPYSIVNLQNPHAVETKTFDEVIRRIQGLSNGKLVYSTPLPSNNGYASGVTGSFGIHIGKTYNDYKIKFDYFITSGIFTS